MLIKPSQSDEQRQKLEALRNELDEKKLLHDSGVQKLLGQAYKCYSQSFYDSYLTRLKLIIEANDTEANRKPDEFRPYCTPALNKGNLHIIDQADGLPIFIDHNKPVTGLGLFGPQGSGKSYEIINFCDRIHQIDPTIKITIIDPKAGFSNLSGFLHLDLLDTAFNLTPPVDVGLEPFIFELMPILAHTSGLIYGLDLLNQAAEKVLEQRREFIDQTKTKLELCLKDLLQVLKKIKVSGFRKIGYQDAAVIALSLILGRLGLFSCRSGVSLDWLFNQNTVLNARSLTDEMQCRFLAIYLLYWLYQRAKNSDCTKSLKHIIIIDDATRFIGREGHQFDAQNRTSQLGHILSVLRESGICLVYATQLPAQVDPAVLSLTRNALVIGNINGEDNLSVIQNMMSLSDEQKAAIVKFKKREVLAFFSDHSWPYPIHGWTPKLDISEYTTETPLKASLDIQSWQSLTDILQQQADTIEPENKSQKKPKKPKSLKDNFNTSSGSLVYDCIQYPFHEVSNRTKRLNMAGSVYNSAMNEAVNDGLLLRSSAGRRIYLIPTKLAYEKYSQDCPYQRSVSIEHSFYVSFIEYVLKQDKTLSKVQAESAIGSKGATADIIATTKSGSMTAYEFTLSTSNLLSNAAKLQDTACEKIIWLCKDAATAKAVEAYFNKNRSLPAELISKFQYIHLVKWLKQQEKKYE